MKEVKCEKCVALKARLTAANALLEKYLASRVGAQMFELDVRQFMASERNKPDAEPTIKDLASALKKLGIHGDILKLIRDAEAGIPADAVPASEEKP